LQGVYRFAGMLSLEEKIGKKGRIIKEKVKHIGEVTFLTIVAGLE
jgi:hypothetical protein